LSNACFVCGSDDTERLTGEEVDFIGFLTAWDLAKGWTYLRCRACERTFNFWGGVCVHWPELEVEA